MSVAFLPDGELVEAVHYFFVCRKLQRQAVGRLYGRQSAGFHSKEFVGVVFSVAAVRGQHVQVHIASELERARGKVFEVIFNAVFAQQAIPAGANSPYPQQIPAILSAVPDREDHGSVGRPGLKLFGNGERVGLIRIRGMPARTSWRVQVRVLARPAFASSVRFRASSSISSCSRASCAAAVITKRESHGRSNAPAPMGRSAAPVRPRPLHRLHSACPRIRVIAFQSRQEKGTARVPTILKNPTALSAVNLSSDECAAIQSVILWSDTGPTLAKSACRFSALTGSPFPHIRARWIAPCRRKDPCSESLLPRCLALRIPHRLTSVAVFQKLPDRQAHSRVGVVEQRQQLRNCRLPDFGKCQ